MLKKGRRAAAGAQAKAAAHKALKRTARKAKEKAAGNARGVKPPSHSNRRAGHDNFRGIHSEGSFRRAA